MISCVVVAAGASRRMGKDKLWLMLNGKPVIQHCLETFEKHSGVSEIVIVVRSETREKVESLAREAGLTKVSAYAEGGAERQDSVWNGLQVTDPEAQLVLVHDAARPLVTNAIINAVSAAARLHGAAVCGTPATDTIKEVDADKRVVRTPARETLFAVQTPQIFKRAVLMEAYEQLRAANVRVTDDTAAVEHSGKPVVVVPCTDVNIKITHPHDLAFAEAVLKTKEA